MNFLGILCLKEPNIFFNLKHHISCIKKIIESEKVLSRKTYVFKANSYIDFKISKQNT